MSTAQLSVSTILNTIVNQKLGFKFGKPDRPSESSLACILPILRETTQQRQYITLPETEEVLITDSGSISKVNLENASKKNVFVRSSTMFEGKGTQSRVLSRSAILFPGKKVSLDVRCIHASHGIHSGNDFKYGGVAPFSVDANTYTSGYTRSDQHTTWDSVRSYSASVRGEAVSTVVGTQRRRNRFVQPDSVTHYHGITTSSLSEEAVPTSGSAFFVGANASFTGVVADDNLKASFDTFAKSFDDILSKARLHDNQVGLALITESGCKTIEAFDVPISWESLHKDAVKRMGTELLKGEDKTNVFEYKPENAIAAVTKVLSLDYKTNLIYEHKPSNGESSVKIYGLTASRYVGEVVELDDRVMHMVILETA